MWTYDPSGRQVREEKLVNDNNYFVTAWDYNSADLMKTMTYPGGNNRQAGETVTYAYHSQMALNSVIGSGTYTLRARHRL
jgi:YD repeat-containing protein